MSVKKIGILYHPKVETTRLKAKELESFLKTQGVSAWVCSAWDTKRASLKMAGTDLVLTVGWGRDHLEGGTGGHPGHDAHYRHQPGQTRVHDRAR